MIKKFFLQNEYIFKKDLYFICNTNTFCIYIYFTFLFFSVKKVFFSVKKFFNIKLIFHIKHFFLKIKSKYFFPKNIFFFNLVLQQMNNHTNFAKFTGRHLC